MSEDPAGRVAKEGNAQAVYAQARATETGNGRAADPPIRLAHLLYVLWVSGTVSWALFAAALAQARNWWVSEPLLGAILVLAPPILGHFLANWLIRLSGNPRFR